MALTQVETSGLSGSGASSNSTTGNVFSQTGPFKNRIINGDMQIDQRNAGASVTLTGAAQYTLDRWVGLEDTDGGMTAQQSSTAPADFTKSLLVTVTSADTSLAATQRAFIAQRIEGFNISDLNWGTANAKSVTLSFWVRSSLTGTFGGSIKNGSSNRSYPFDYSVISADTWEYKTVTIPGDTSGTWASDNSSGLALSFGLGAGSTYSGTAGAWAGTDYQTSTGAVSVIGTNGATFYITGVQLEAGSVATPFERRSYGQELALCQRYYEKSFDPETPPGTATTVGASIYSNQNSQANTNFSFYKVTKRAVPTVTIYSPFNGAAGQSWIGGSSNATMNVFNSGTSGFGTAPAVTQILCNIVYQWTASIEL